MTQKKSLRLLFAAVGLGFFCLVVDRYLLEFVATTVFKHDDTEFLGISETATQIQVSKQSDVWGRIPQPLKNNSNDKSFWKRETSIKLTSANCQRLIAGDQREIAKSLRVMQDSQPLDIVPFFSTLKVNKDCDAFKRRREYVTQGVSSEEANFPIAYSILVYKDFSQVERLLRAIYRPHNFYCIHHDNKSTTLFKERLRELVHCFDNVFLSSRSVLVRWGYFTVLEADLICMRDLLKYKSWKYLINLTGQEFPLKTNWQIVKILKTYQGANDISGSLLLRDDKRLTKKERPPHNITVVKGPVHMAASRAFVEYIFSDQKAKDFLNWVHGTQVPDETYFPTLQNNPHLGAPGAFGGGQELMEKTLSMVRYKLWYYSTETCHGKRVRLICVFNIGDLPNLTQAKQLFANKFHHHYGQHAYDCLEEWHRNRTRDEYLGIYEFDVREYSRLPFVKYRTNLR